MIGWSVFLLNFLNFRTLWLSGRTGGGKTALAVRIAYELLDREYVRHVVSNIPMAFATDPWSIQPDEADRLHTLVILDEGGMFLKTTSDTEQYLAFLRKSNIYIIVPSVKEPHRDLRILSCERLFNAQKIGFKGWVYQYLLRTALVKETEKFFWPDPSEVYGLYDTDARPVDDFGISDWLIYHKEKAVEKYYGEHQRRVKSYENKEGPDGVRAMEGAGRWAELFYEAAQEIRAASEAVSLPDQKRQSGRK